jgi:hypothetical protein
MTISITTHGTVSLICAAEHKRHKLKCSCAFLSFVFYVVFAECSRFLGDFIAMTNGRQIQI